MDIMRMPTTSSNRRTEPTLPRPVVAQCPSCNTHSVFTFLGVQHWPVRVAQMMGTKTSIKLWQCGHCSSTISDIEDQTQD